LERDSASAKCRGQPQLGHDVRVVIEKIRMLLQKLRYRFGIGL
jgi:hypothetical protein